MHELEIGDEAPEPGARDTVGGRAIACEAQCDPRAVTAILDN